MKKTYWIVGIVVILIIVGGIYFYPKSSPEPAPQIQSDQDYLGLIEIIEGIDSSKEDILLIEELIIEETGFGKNTYVVLNIQGDIPNEILIREIQSKLIEKHPECFSKDSDCEDYVEIRLKYNGEIESDWQIDEDYIDMKV
tara:strand:- start:284 stop:706 length:423 start_codon:yes stop_codon:yes gene_type:complete